MTALLDRDFLIKNLCFMYRLIVASAPLLEFAIPRSRGELREYYEKHYAEEVGHDAMLLRDLHSLGIKDIPFDYTATQLAGAQYYLIAHHHPALLIGYMMVMEGSPLSAETIKDAEATHDCELTVLRHHSAHDRLHFKDLEQIRASMTPELQDAIAWNAAAVRQILNAEFERWAHAEQHH